ncbi:MAG: amidohydrolase family protein [Pseudomonadota bacterium]
MITKSLTALAAALTLSASAALAQSFAISGGTVWTGTDAGTIENGVVIIEDGLITAVGPAGTAVPPGATAIDASGKWVTPGIIAAMSRVGIVEVGAESSTNDIAAGDDGAKFSASLNAADSFNPAATAIAVARIDGITRMAVAPGAGNRIFGGQGFIATTSGAPDSVAIPKSFAFITMDEGAASRTGGSRSAAWAELEAAIGDAYGFPGKFFHEREGDTLSAYDARAFKAVTMGQQLLLIEANRASDLRRIIKLSEDHPDLRIAIVGATEGWLVADELAAADIPVIVDPFDNLPSSFAALAATQENAARLIDAGVDTAYYFSGSVTHRIHLTVQVAGNSVANGVSFDDAMAAITSVPAEIYGLENAGFLGEGALADVVIWDGDPLETTTSPDVVIIDGVRQAMESRQTRLRDRYIDLEGETEFRYRRPE